MKQALNLEKVKHAANKLSLVSEKQVNMYLNNLSEVILLRKEEIIRANEKDVANAQAQRLSLAFIDRLKLDATSIEKLIHRLDEIRKLDNGLGEIIEERIVEKNILLRKVRVPLGVITVIYEARPEVTIDVAALCIKSGNAAILKGGSEALETNKVLFHCVSEALGKSGLSRETVSFISSSDRRITNWLLAQGEYIDLVIARGGYGLVKAVLAASTIPVLAHAAGGARIYVDKSADLALAEKIIINAKTNKPAACNSLDTIVIHQDIADEFEPKITSYLKARGVKMVKNDWDREFLDLRASVKIVKDIDQALEFINSHSKKHSEGIIATDQETIDFFTKSVDAAAVFINCSTRLHDGYVFGLGAEMGISTGKLHARGPVGLKELTTYKWEVYGNGQIRE